MRRSLVGLFVAILIAAGASAAFADRDLRRDADDTAGMLDIRSIAHAHDSRGRLIHTIRTFEAWETRSLPARDDNYLGLLFESPSDEFGSDRFVWVRRSKTRGLYAELYRVGTHANGDLLRRVPVWRPDSRSVRVAIEPRFLGNDFADGYRWRATSSFEKGTDGPCRRDLEDSSFPTGRCTDSAPGPHERGLRHDL